MNSISGTIKEIETDGSLSLVSLETAAGLLTCIVIDTPATCSYLIYGKALKVIFKETEVAIGKSDLGTISLRNQVAGQISQIDHGALLSRVVLSTPAGEIKSIISTRSAREMALQTGEEVFALIKTNEIMLAE